VQGKGQLIAAVPLIKPVVHEASLDAALLAGSSHIKGKVHV
jgi:hypothetical protein